MQEFFQNILLSDSSIDIVTLFLRVFLAVVFGGIIGNERGKHGSQAGLRTHILVCLGASLTSLAGIYASEVLGYSVDPFRISAQVISGIGFLGAGMIIVKNGNSITGLTTAAGMWTTATIGITLGMGFYAGAAVIMLACVFTSAFLTRIERKRKNSIHLYIEINDLSLSGKITDQIREILNQDCLIEVVAPKSHANEHLGIYITTKTENLAELRTAIDAIDGVIFSIVE